MKHLIVLVFVLWSSSSFSQITKKHGPFKDYYKNGQLKKEGFYKKNKKSGIWKDYYNTGELSGTYTYNSKGKRTGLEEKYFKNGNTKSKTTKFKEDSLITQAYYKETGNLFYEMIETILPKSDNKIKNGYYKEYYKNKVLKIESNYIDNELSGTWKQFYKSGEKEWEVDYILGIKQGAYKQYYKDGTLKLEGTSVDNLKNGKENRYDTNGKLEWKGTYLKNNFDNNWMQYDSIGNVINTLKYKNGKLKKSSNKIALSPTKVPDGVFESVPVYPGCENLIGNILRKKCMSQKIALFVNRNFDTNTAHNLGLEGKQRIYILFKVDTKGKVKDIRARTSHPVLEKEAIAVIKRLPKMKPGFQRSKAVTVPYALPIIFMAKGKPQKKDPFDDNFFKQQRP